MTVVLRLSMVAVLFGFVETQLLLVAGEGMRSLHEANPFMFIAPTFWTHPVTWAVAGFMLLWLLLAVSLPPMGGLNRTGIAALAGLMSLLSFFLVVDDTSRDQLMTFGLGAALDLVLALLVTGQLVRTLLARRRAASMVRTT